MHLFTSNLIQGVVFTSNEGEINQKGLVFPSKILLYELLVRGFNALQNLH